MAASRPHVVRQGEYLSALAFRFGTTVKEILADPKNAELKTRRHPEILNPLDIVYLPEPPGPSLAVTAEADNPVSAVVPTVDVDVCLSYADGKPLAGKAVETTPALGDAPLTTDGDGNLTLTLPITLKVVRLTIADERLHFDLHVGHLDPHDEASGLRSRLRQLGYVGQEEEQLVLRSWLDVDPSDLAEQVLRNGIEAFQQERGETATGEATADVCATIKDEYGC